MPFPIWLGDKRINDHEPLWIKNPSECTKDEYLAFYRHLYPFQEDPLFWVHLNVDYPFHLKGILFFPKFQKNFDINKSTIKLYCNRVFVSDNCKDVIPDYLMALRGVIDSPDIPLNVSRSYLQMDRNVRQLSGHIAKKVSDSLTQLYRNEKETFLNCWNDLSLVLKIGAIEDDKFYDRVKHLLLWKTSQGDWITAEEYLEKNKEKVQNKILYTSSEKDMHHMLDIYTKQGIDVLIANHPVDSYLMNHLEKKVSSTFQRIDGAIDDSLVDKQREKSLLDNEGKTEATRLADFVRGNLKDLNVDVEAKSLVSDDIPGFVMIEESQRRFRDYLKSINPKDQEGIPLHKSTFVVNTNSPLMSRIQKIGIFQPDLARELVKQTYELALLSQGEMESRELSGFIKRSQHVLDKLTEKIG